MRLSQGARIVARRVGQSLREELYIRSGVDRTRPLAIRGVLTERCNYRCAYCAFWRQESYPEEMSVAQWQAALTSLRSFVGRYVIQFSGGEPFLHAGFLTIAAHCRAHGIQWGVITNGSALTESIAERVVAAGPLNVDISVDGDSAEVHDRVRGVAGSLARIRAGIERLRRAREAAGERFAIRIKPTVHRLNFATLPAIVRWAVDVGATSVDFAPVRPWAAEVTASLWLDDEAERQRVLAVVEELEVMRRAGAPIETSPDRMRQWAAHFRREPVQPELSPCRVGMRDYHILPDGDVRTCWFYPPIGNVKTQSARAIWLGAAARAQRRTMLACPRFGSTDCASSCLAHRSLRQDIRRGLLLALGKKANVPARASSAPGDRGGEHSPPHRAHEPTAPWSPPSGEAARRP